MSVQCNCDLQDMRSTCFCKYEVRDTEIDRHKLSCENLKGQLGSAVLQSFDNQNQAEETFVLTQLFEMGTNTLLSKSRLSLCLGSLDVPQSQYRAFNVYWFAFG